MPLGVEDRWPRHYRCCYCKTLTRATIRVFSGVHGGGWPACDAHKVDAITDAMRSLLDGSKIADGYKVTAHQVVVDEGGWPMLGRRLFTVRRRTDVGG